jgi:hypothetical protein
MNQQAVSGLGVMGYRTPNIDRVGLEGIRFTDLAPSGHRGAGRVHAARAGLFARPSALGSAQPSGGRLR